MEIKLIIGLGNPGAEYEKTYHNVGFAAIDYFAKNPPNSKLLKSGVYMNQSGGFVKKTLKKYKAKPEELLIIHDDSDIELGKYKISFGRGAAGHKGVQSIVDAIGSKDFWRLRIGIRRGAARNGYAALAVARPAAKRAPRLGRKLMREKAGEFVLKKIGKENMRILEKTFTDALNQKQWRN